MPETKTRKRRPIPNPAELRDEDLVRAQVVAAWLTVAPKTVYRLMQAGALGCVHVGAGERGGIRILVRQYREYLAANTREAKAAS